MRKNRPAPVCKTPLWSYHADVVEHGADYYTALSKTAEAIVKRDGQPKVRKLYAPKEKMWAEQRHTVCYASVDIRDAKWEAEWNTWCVGEKTSDPPLPPTPAVDEKKSGYGYSGAVPKVYPWNDLLSKLVVEGERLANAHRTRTTPVKFTRALINHYPNGKSVVGDHSDEDAKDKYIASFSFYPEAKTIPMRDLVIYVKANPQLEIKKSRVANIMMGQGSVVLMHPEMQDQYQHGLPERSTILTGRINVTLRE